jgi:hypothetical protein
MTLARSVWTESKSTTSFRRAANAPMVWSASYRARLNRRSTLRCTRDRSGVNSAAAARVDAATGVRPVAGGRVPPSLSIHRWLGVGGRWLGGPSG